MWTSYFTKYQLTLDGIEPKDIQIRAREYYFSCLFRFAPVFDQHDLVYKKSVSQIFG